MRFWASQKIKTGNNIYSFILTADNFNVRINLELQSVQLYEITAQKKKLPTLSTNSEMSPKSTRLATSNISIRDMLRDVKNVARKLYINADGSENFMFCGMNKKEELPCAGLQLPPTVCLMATVTPLFRTVILYLYLLYNKTYWMTKNIANLPMKVSAAVFIGIMRILILLGILKSVIYGREHYFLGFSWIYLS